MPNWCSTEIEIYHNDTKALDALYHKIEEWTNKDYMENGFGHNWLGNIVLGSEIGTVDQGKKSDIRCRGALVYCEVCDHCLKISTETAWSPMLEMWCKVIDKYLPGGQLFYEAFEPGCGVCCTNNTDLIGKYFLDFCDASGGVYDTFSKAELTSFLQKKCGTNIGDINKLCSMCEENCDYIGVHEWEYMPAEEWD